MKLVALILAAIIAFTACGIFGVQSFKNTAISYEEQINSAKSDIEVQQKRRADLIPNLVECVKAYDEHEYNTLMDIVASRGQTIEGSEEIQTLVAAVAEAYPELKSNQNYKELMNELATTENLIANYRTNYNSWVKKYNAYVRKFPNKQFLDLLGYEVIEVDFLTYETSEDAPTNLFGKE